MNLAQICLPYHTHAYMSVEDKNGEPVVRLETVSWPLELSIISKV
jgi:hypothetical protein